MRDDRVGHEADGICVRLLLGSKLISLLTVTVQYFPVSALGQRLTGFTTVKNEKEKDEGKK